MLGWSLSTPYTFLTRADPVLGWRFMMQVAILTLAVVGVWRHRHRADAVLLLSGVVVCIVGVHWLVSMLFPRYIYPAMPLLLTLAAGALVRPGPEPKVGARR